MPQAGEARELRRGAGVAAARAAEGEEAAFGLRRRARAARAALGHGEMREERLIFVFISPTAWIIPQRRVEVGGAASALAVPDAGCGRTAPAAAAAPLAAREHRELDRVDHSCRIAHGRSHGGMWIVEGRAAAGAFGEARARRLRLSHLWRRLVRHLKRRVRP